MKILQLNIWGGKLGKQIVELLQREQPDVVCFQEAMTLPGNWGILFSTLEEIKEEAKYDYDFFSPHFSIKFMKRMAHSGPAIISRVPFEHTHSFFTRLEFAEDFDILGTDYNMRALQHVVVKNGEKPLHILNHHGHHIGQHKNGDTETMRQCKMIADYIQTLEGDVVLCGDFNLAPHSESLELLNAILTNHCIEADATTTRTPLTRKTEVCDYIFASKGLATKNFKILPEIASDHAALVIEAG